MRYINSSTRVECKALQLFNLKLDHAKTTHCIGYSWSRAYHGERDATGGCRYDELLPR